MASVTYKGPSRKGDGTTRVRVGKTLFPVDQAVEVDDKAVLDQVQNLEGHKFEVEASAKTDKSKA